MIETEDHGGIRLLRMTHGRANAMDLAFLTALREAVESASDADAIVITGQGRIFCAGVDLVQLLDGGDAYRAAFIPELDRCFTAVATAPVPVVAAINGHAIAGGAVLACAADHRVAAEGGRIGVPELVVGVPFPPVAYALTASSVEPRRFRELVLRGKLVSGDDRLEAGFADEITSAEACLPRALEVAAELARTPRVSYATAKDSWRADIRAAAADVEGLRRVTDLWSDPSVVGAVRAYVEQTLKR